MNAAFVDLVVARDQIQQCGLAAAVRANQTMHLARAKLERDAVYGNKTAKTFGDSSGFETLVHRLGRTAMRSASRSGSMLVDTAGSRRSLAARLTISSPKPPGSTSTTRSKITP